MATEYDDLDVEGLGGVRFGDPAAALASLRALPGDSVTDDTFGRLLPGLLASLAVNPDPDRALANLAVWLERVGSRTMYCRLLIDHPVALDCLLTLFATSQFLSDILIRNPEYFEVLANPRIRDRGRSLDDFLSDARRRIAVAATPGKKRDALRRFKPPEVLRIGLRDILGYATFDQTVTEISDFAEACVRAALEICDATDQFAVIGMGKLGARELNYASDIDLIFVHSDDLPQAKANKLAEAVRDTLATVTDAGYLFRVDLRLRPEGRFGAISRSISGCRAYYESWAEPWERQALIKARFVGGDAAVGDQFIEIAQRFAYRKLVTQDFVDAIRAGKRRLEEQTARAGEAATNVKQGIGAIRDVEFAVQLLQLIAGGQHPQLRVRATLPALDALAEVGLITTAERDRFAGSYRFLRNVEHRLQILDERPVRNLPITNSVELDKFGRRLGYASGAEFLRDYRKHTTQVHADFQQIFYGGEGPGDSSEKLDDSGAHANVTEWVLGIADPGARQQLAEHMRGLRFADVNAAVAILESSELGGNYGEIGPEARDRFARLAPRLLAGASSTGQPDSALRAFDALSVAVPSRSALYGTLIAEPDLLDRLLVLAAKAPVLWSQLVGHLEYLDLLADDSQLEAGSPAIATSEAVARFIRHERLRIGARDVWGLIGVRDVMRELTATAQVTLATALRIPGFEDIAGETAVVGLGKLGGRETGYGSDLDVLWVASDTADIDRATVYARKVMSFIKDDLKRYDAPYDIDARLRPDGRVGVLVRTVSAYAEYLGSAAETWEKQALIKARRAAGNATVGAAFESMARSVIYDHPLTASMADELRHMKHRIETERCKDPADIKLGPGGLSDVEWTAQMLQWRHGKRWPKAQVTGTLDALDALRDAAMLRQTDWDVLTSGYAALTAQRNRQWLGGGELTAQPESGSDRGGDASADRLAVREVFSRLFLES